MNISELKANILELKEQYQKDYMDNISWNLLAFCFSFLWLFSQKLFFAGTIAIFFIVICSVNEMTFCVSLFIVSLICGLFGNAMIQQHLKKIYAQIDTSQVESINKFHKNQSFAPVVLIFLTTILNFIVMYGGYNLINILFCIIWTGIIVFFIYRYYMKTLAYLINSNKKYSVIKDVSVEYLLMFQDIENGKFFSFNFIFMICDFLWAIFKKMYKEACVLFIFYVFIIYIDSFLIHTPNVMLLMFSSVLSTINIMLVIGGINIIYYRHAMLKYDLPFLLPENAVKKYVKVTFCVLLFVCCVNLGNQKTFDEKFLNLYLNNVKQTNSEFTKEKRDDAIKCYNKFYNENTRKISIADKRKSNFLSQTKIKDQREIYNTILQDACLDPPFLLRGIYRIIIYCNQLISR